MTKIFKHIVFMCLLIILGNPANAQLFPNGDFEAGPAGGCVDPTGYVCNNDAGWVVDGVHPVFTTLNQGCISSTTNYTNSLGAHSGVGYVYFYAGGDNITTSSINFAMATDIELCVWYAGPQGAGAPGQNTANSHFSFGVDGAQVGPDVLVPTGTVWTQFCFTTTVSAGNHTFNVLSGGAAQYSLWFDDFFVNEVNTNPCVPPIITGNLAYCEGSSATLNAGSGIGWTYSWSTGATTQSISADISDNPVTVTVTDNNGCVETSAAVNVIENPAPNPTITGNLSYCAGASTTLNAGTGNGWTYLWSTNATTQSINATVTNNPITVTVTDNNTCPGQSAAINLVENPIPAPNITGDLSLCSGSGTILNAGTGIGWTYLWNTTAIIQTITVIQPGTYWVEVTANGCSGSDTVIVTSDPTVGLDLGNDTSLCDGDVLLLDATINNATYLWQDNSVNSVITITNQGTYWVSVSLGNCSSSDTIVVDYNPLPVVNLGNDTSFCEGHTLLLNATTAGASYLWQDNSTNPTFTASQTGAYWVEVTVNGCTGTDGINIITTSDLAVSSLITTPCSCNGFCDGSVQMSITGGTGVYTYNLGAISSSTSTFTNLCADDYAYSAVDGSGCSVSGNVTVSEPDPITAIMPSNQLICSGFSVSLCASVAGGNSPFTYIWTSNSVVVGNTACISVNPVT